MSPRNSSESLVRNAFPKGWVFDHRFPLCRTFEHHQGHYSLRLGPGISFVILRYFTSPSKNDDMYSEAFPSTKIDLENCRSLLRTAVFQASFGRVYVNYIGGKATNMTSLQLWGWQWFRHCTEFKVYLHLLTVGFLQGFCQARSKKTWLIKGC